MDRYSEVERKFDADPGALLPDLSGAAAAVREAVESQLDATYFDTADTSLARHHVTLRRRTGGDDAGWHLKLPAGLDERTEVRLPLGRATRKVPVALAREVRALVRDRPLVPIAVLHTTRIERRLLDGDGNTLATIADDTVHGQRLADGAVQESTWREVEVELLHGDRSLLDAVSSQLQAGGLTPSESSSKLARVLGDSAQPTPEAAPEAMSSPTGRHHRHPRTGNQHPQWRAAGRVPRRRDRSDQGVRPRPPAHPVRTRPARPAGVDQRHHRHRGRAAVLVAGPVADREHVLLRRRTQRHRRVGRLRDGHRPRHPQGHQPGPDRRPQNPGGRPGRARHRRTRPTPAPERARNPETEERRATGSPPTDRYRPGRSRRRQDRATTHPCEGPGHRPGPRRATSPPPPGAPRTANGAAAAGVQRRSMAGRTLQRLPRRPQPVPGDPA